MADPLPSKIGKYEIRGALGEGGFGRVYKAYDPTVGRPVALKVLTSQGSPDMLARFQNEATAAGNLHHENIVTIYEFGVFNDAPYIAMEFLEGSDLNQIMASGPPLSILDKVRIMMQVGQGLQCAHDNGVVHRDVKPANIKVLPNRAVKMMDFGIARLTRDDSTRLTQKGDLVGTIRYMSPEQFQGLDVDTLCDIFAYGVIFYELISGVHPFDAPDVASFMYKITEAVPVPLSHLVPECPPTLEEIVMRALEKDRDLRYQSLEDLLLDMQPVLMELKKERAGELMHLAHDLVASREIAKAQAWIKEIIELDPSNPEVWELREQANQLAHRATVRPRVELLLKSADADLERRLFPEAIESLEAAARLDPTDTAIAKKLADARRHWEDAIRAARLVSDAGRELERQNLTVAARLAAEAVSADPSNAKAAEVAEAIRTSLSRRDNERRLKQALDDARRQAAVEDFDAAIEILSGATDVDDPSGQIPAALARVRDQKLEHARQERLRSEKQALRGILKESRYTDALPRLEALCAEFPGDGDLATLLDDTRRQIRVLQQADDLRRARQDASALQSAQRYAEAEEVFRRLDGLYPGDPEIVYLLREARRLRDDYERSERLAAMVQTVEQLRVECRFEEARRALDAAPQEFSGEGALLDQRKKLDAEWNAYRRVERVRQLIASARAKIAEGQPDSALSLLKQAAAEDPQNREIADLQRDAEAMAEVQRVSRSIDQACTQARDLAGVQDFDAALSILRGALQTYPGDPRLLGLSEAVSGQKREWEAGQRLREAVRQATQLLREKRYPEAIHLLEIHLDTAPGEPGLVKLLNQARTEWDSARRAEALNRAMAEIQAAIDANRLDEAEVLVEHYAPEFGSSPVFIALRNLVQEAVRKAERKRRTAEAVDQIRALRMQGNRGAALEVCQAALARDPDTPELLDLLTDLHQEIARERRVTEVSRLSALVKQAIEVQDWATASTRIDELGRQYPNDPAVAALRESLRIERKRAEADQAFDALEETLARRDWAKAEKQLLAAGALAPDSPRIAEVRSRIERGKRRDKAIAEARVSLTKKRFDEAERLLKPLVEEDKADSDAAALLFEAQTRRDSADSKRAAEEAEGAIRQGRKQAKALSKERDFESAARILQELIDRYGRQTDLDRELEEYSAAAKIQKQILALEEIRRSGDARRVQHEATLILARGEVPEARELLNWADTALKQDAPGPPAVETPEQRESARKDLLSRLERMVAAGDRDGARLALADGLKTFPGDPGLLEWQRRLTQETPPPPPPPRPLWKRPAVLGIAVVLVLLGVWMVSRLMTPHPVLKVFAPCPKDGKVGVSYACAMTTSGGAAPFRWTVSAAPLPPGLVLSESAGTIVGTPAQKGDFKFSVRATDQAGSTADAEVKLSIGPKDTVGIGPKIETSMLRPGTVGDRYGETLEATGGTGKYVWILASGKLPAGLTLDKDFGTISGRPSAEGTSELRVRVTDRAGKSDERTFTLSIVRGATPAVEPLRITTTSLPDGTVGVDYRAMLTEAGGKQPYQWTLSPGPGLPNGLRLDATTGVIAGTPLKDGRSDFTVVLSDGKNPVATGRLGIVIKPAVPSIPRCPNVTASAVTEGEYGGRLRGVIEWRGQTQVAGGRPVTVLIDGKSPRGGGSVTDQSIPLPGVPVKLTVPADARMVEPPSKQTGWSCFVFQPGSTSVRIDWAVDFTLK